MDRQSLGGVYLVQGGQMARATNRDGRLALAAVHLLQDASHLTSDDVDRRLADYQQGMDEAAERKRAGINLLPLRVVAPDAAPRREWPVVTSVECGLRRHDNRFAEAAAHLLKAERARDDGQAALRESRRTLARAQEERGFAERRWRRALRLRELAWKVLGAAVLLGAGNGAWSIALLAASWRQWAGTLAGGGIVLLALVLMERRRSR
jgi:hypothetical protein